MWKVLRAKAGFERFDKEFTDDQWSDGAETMFPRPDLRLETRDRMFAAALAVQWLDQDFVSVRIYHDGFLIEDRQKGERLG
jgi:hypothetical protein